MLLGTRRSLSAVAVLAILACGVGSALAATIVGTPKNDVLRGTPRNDTLSGKAGNDTLYGRAGNDVLRGGPGKDKLIGGAGADRLFCGAGIDAVVADAKDKIAADCEKGRPRPAPRPPPPLAQPGAFAGTTSQSRPISFEVTSLGLSVHNFVVGYAASCTPRGQYTGQLTLGGPSGHVAIGTDRRFTLNFGPSVLTGDTLTLAVAGSFDASGTNASGTVQLHAVVSSGGTEYQCDTGSLTWTAARR